MTYMSRLLSTILDHFANGAPYEGPWHSREFYDLMKLLQFYPSTYNWMIGAMLCFLSKTTNNLHLPCGMGPLFLMCLLSLDFFTEDIITSDMRPEKEYSIN
ncbi:hypothetical protein Ahy_B05g079051 [Arachis hypogaea]|uniref:Aminotransferase-like plant mobile domain-containing protein n=1 Tax=Arachis hypogaea TaxID=3818 RepID=A0A444Z8V0_ARAHY|nr:hypothetical protein Ahy_B05g079051 [Arachis hypogaea]